MPITPLGTPGGIYKPQLRLGKEPLAFVSTTNSVGQLSRAACGVKPESVAKIREGGEVTVDGATLFKGSGWAPRGRATAVSLDFGFSLIHPAHKIDEGRAWAPGLHPMSTEHYTFTMGAGGYTSLDDSLFADQRLMKFDLTKSLAEEIPDFILRGMEVAAKQRVSANLEQTGLDGNVANNNPEVVAALEDIIPIGECKLVVRDGFGGPGMSSAVSRYGQKLLHNSVTSNKSAWDLLAIFYSAFGMQIICWPDGSTRACPDFTGCKPPKGNRITGDIVASWDGSAAYTRSPRGVVVISHGFTKGFSGAKPPNGESLNPIAGNVGEYMTDRPGGLFITGLPGWMMPYTNGAKPELPKDMAQAYAKQVFAEVSNLGRTFVISTPLTPEALPGTTYFFETTSNAKNLTDGGEVSTPFDSEYAGYCFKIEHKANTEGQMHTHWHFRNIFDPEDYDLMMDSAPFFGDEPFEVPFEEGGGDKEGDKEGGGDNSTQ